MNYRKLGRSGVRVSTLCLGTMMFGGQTEESAATRIIARAREAGVNFIDTADVYNAGRAEEIVGRAVADDRAHWVLATKAGNPMGTDVNRRGLARRWILQAADESLQRLGTEYIDIYYLHREDPHTPLAETVRAVGDLMRWGKIRYFGLSNHRSWRLAEICNLCDGLGIERPIVSQPYYNALNRMPEVEHLPACGYYGVGVAPYSPVARGVLTGKYDPDAPPPESSRAGRKDRRILETEWRRESLLIARKLRDHAASCEVSPAQFAVGWVLNNGFVSSAICGPRTEEQWEDYLGAVGYAFTAEDEAVVDALVAPGHPSTPGYTDPAYPLEGREPRSSGSRTQSG